MSHRQSRWFTEDYYIAELCDAFNLQLLKNIKNKKGTRQRNPVVVFETRQTKEDEKDNSCFEISLAFPLSITSNVEKVREILGEFLSRGIDVKALCNDDAIDLSDRNAGIRTKIFIAVDDYAGEKELVYFHVSLSHPDIPNEILERNPQGALAQATSDWILQRRSIRQMLSEVYVVGYWIDSETSTLHVVSEVPEHISSGVDANDVLQLTVIRTLVRRAVREKGINDRVVILRDEHESRDMTELTNHNEDSRLSESMCGKLYIHTDPNGHSPDRASLNYLMKKLEEELKATEYGDCIAVLIQRDPKEFHEEGDDEDADWQEVSHSEIENKTLASHDEGVQKTPWPSFLPRRRWYVQCFLQEE